MMNVTPSPKRRRRGLWWKIPLTLLLLLVVLLAVVWFRLSAIVTSQANRLLPELLGAEASVERIELQPAQGVAAIHGLKIGQPDGFGEGQMIELTRVFAEIDMGSLTSADGVLVRAVEVEGLIANITKDKDGVLNVLRLSSHPTTESAGPAAHGSPTEAGAEDSKTHQDHASKPFPGLRIGLVTISQVAVNYLDESTGEKPIEIALGNVDIQLVDGHLTLGEQPEVKLGEGAVTLENIQIAQPAGFGEDPLLTFPRLHLDIGSEPFVKNVVRLQRLEAEGLRASIVRNTNGVMNVARLAGGPPPPPAAPEAEPSTGDDEPAADTVAEGKEPGAPPAEGAPPGSPVGFHVVELALTDFGVIYRDAALDNEQPLEIVVQDLSLSVGDLMAFLSESPVAFAAVTLEAGIAQGEHPTAELSLFAQVGPVGMDLPDVNAHLRLTGFMFDTLGSLIPPGARQATGANGIDSELAMAHNPSGLDVNGTAKTDAGHSYPIIVKGPLDQLTVDMSPIGMAIAGRLGGGVANLATGTAGASLDIAKGVSGDAFDAAKGAGSVIGKVGGGLFKSTKAAVTMDMEELGAGLKQATVHAVAEAGHTVGEAGEGMVEVGKTGARGVTGRKRTVAWQEKIQERHTAETAAARDALAEMPFPPPPVEVKSSEGDAAVQDPPGARE